MTDDEQRRNIVAIMHDIYNQEVGCVPCGCLVRQEMELIAAIRPRTLDQLLTCAVDQQGRDIMQNYGVFLLNAIHPREN